MEVIESCDLERNLEATSPISLFKFKNPLQQFPNRQTSNLDLKTYNIYIVCSIWGQFQLTFFFFLLRQYLHLCNVCQLTLYLPLVLQRMTLIPFALDIFYFLLCTNLKNTYVCMQYIMHIYLHIHTFSPQQYTIPRILLQVYS